METKIEKQKNGSYTLIAMAIAKETCPNGWDSQMGLEIEYQMRRFADSGYFIGKTQDEVDDFLKALIFIATAGFQTAKTKM